MLKLCAARRRPLHTAHAFKRAVAEVELEARVRAAVKLPETVAALRQVAAVSPRLALGSARHESGVRNVKYISETGLPRRGSPL